MSTSCFVFKKNGGVWGRAGLRRVILAGGKMPRHGSGEPKTWRDIGQVFCEVAG